MSSEFTLPAKAPPVTLETLPAMLLEMLLNLATQKLKEDQFARLTYDGLTTLLPAEHSDSFNTDMSQAIQMITTAQFDLSPTTLASNILPHYANFLAGQIQRGLIYYSPAGVPCSLEITMDSHRLAIAKITWLYSVVGCVTEPTMAKNQSDGSHGD